MTCYPYRNRLIAALRCFVWLFAATANLAAWQSVVAQSVIAVGAGSYADSVPTACQETDSYYGLPADQVTGANGFFHSLHLDPALQGKPIPTNKWWTDLLVATRSYLPNGAKEYVLQQDPYGGNLWFYPGMLKPQSYGLDLYFPNAWEAPNANGNPNGSIDRGPALQVHGDRGYAIPSDDVLVADFESGYPSGWTATPVAGYPNAFGSGPAQGSWTGQSPAPSGYLGNGLVNTYLVASNQGGNNYEGILSGNTTVQRKYFHLLVGGGNDPVNTVVRLRVGGNIVASATGQQSGALSWATWDVSAYQGQTATVEIVDTSSAGWGFILCDEIVQSDVADPAGRYGTDFAADESVVTNWGDWNVDFKLPNAASGQELDVTMARGIPFTWTTWKNGLLPKIMTGSVSPLDVGGSPINTSGGSFVASAFSFNYQGRTFGVFLPDNTVVKVASGYLEPQLSGSNNYLVIGYLPSASNLAEFAGVAYARPTNTQISWNYNPAAGNVSTNWNITTTAMKGGNLSTIQGWLPHHYRTTNGLPAFSTYSYLTPRGTMKCATGTNFTVNFPFNGMVPISPAPVATGATNDYQPARMRAYLNGFDPGTMMGDTYWSGKALALCSQYMAWAKQTGDDADFTRLKTALETAFANWLTYTPGETQGFFAYYSDWHALIGWDASYGSQAFNDLHFHYGYFTTAAATLAMYDPAFVAKYQPMLTMLAKCYANYDRNDASEPFLRTFDVWEGHSNAGGLSSGDGENQESSSEAMQGWAGLFLLGGVNADSQMTAAGAMGFAMESAATNEYWEDLWETNLPAAYGRAFAGQVYGSSYNYGTFFSGDPAWVYGIQFGPSNHWLNYLTRYQPGAVADKYNAMWTERANWAAAQTQWDANTAYPKGHWVTYNHVIYSPKADWPAGNPPPPQDIANWNVEADCSRSEPDVLGDSPGHVVLCYQALFDADTAAAEFERYYAANEDLTHLDSQGGSTYYLIHSIRQMGQQDFTATTSSPLSSVYYNAATGKYSVLAYNPSGVQQNVTVYRNGSAVGTFPVPAQTLIDSHLDEALAHLALTPSNAAQTIKPGQTVQFTLTGYDQYGATYPLTVMTWTVSGGGTIDTNGLFTATTNAYPVTVTATSGGLSQTYAFRVGAAPVLSAINVTPGFTRVVQGSTAQFTAAGFDQYGNAYPLSSVTWSISGVGTISNAGLYTASALGTSNVTATSGSVSSTVLAVTHAPLTNLALKRVPVVLASDNNGNVPANATDGDLNSRWESAYSDNQWLYVDLGKIYDLTSVNVVWEDAYAATYDVQVSNDASDASWQTITSVTKTSKATDSLSVTGTGRYLKLRLNTRALPLYGFSIYELQVYGYVNAASITPQSVALSPANVITTVGQQTQFQAYAFDGNYDGGPATATAWAASGGGTVDATGLFSATTVGGPFTVIATVSGVIGSTGLTVGAATTGPVPSTFGAWQSQVFTAAELNNLGISGPNATPAGDGISNLLKYALHLAPKLNGTAGLPVVSSVSTGGQAYLALTYTRLLTATDLTYTVETSGNLSAWASGSGSTAAVSAANNPDGQTQTIVVRDLVPESTAGKRFLHLKVTSP